jgi:hypothetical protein
VISGFKPDIDARNAAGRSAATQARQIYRTSRGSKTATLVLQLIESAGEISQQGSDLDAIQAMDWHRPRLSARERVARIEAYQKSTRATAVSNFA